MQEQYDPSRDLYKRLEEKLIDSIVSRSYIVQESEDEDSYEIDDYNDEFSDVSDDDWEGDYNPILDEEDVLILLEREVHFSGSFKMMLSYYTDENHKGIHEDVSLQRIQELMHIEEALQRNLASLVLRGSDAEQVVRFKKMYQEMRDILSKYYDSLPISQQSEIPPPYILLLECILSEEPVEVLVEAHAEYFRQNPSLLYPIVQSSMLYNHLAPGYGKAPLLAISILNSLQDTQAMEILFDQLYSIDHEDQPELDEALLFALRSFGPVVKQKMLRFIENRPLGHEGEKALHVLLEFLPDEEISKIALDQLMKQDIASTQALSYLALLLESLPDEDRMRFQKWLHQHGKDLPYEVLSEIRHLGYAV